MPISAQTTAPIVIGLGEALFDVFPDRETLGGAPLNMAVHARQLGNRARVVSRIGRDARADQVVDALTQFDMPTASLQRDDKRPTGIVRVTVQDHEPNYEIVPDVAWDYLEFTPQLAELAAAAAGVCFGTLAQRAPTSRNAVRQFVRAANGAVRLFDVNLRQQYFDGPLLADSLQISTAVKLNENELTVLQKLLGLRGGQPMDVCRALVARYDLEFVAWTRGALGTTVVDETDVWEVEPIVVDTSAGTPVGAGDATAAALMHGRLANWDWTRTLTLANRLGAYVATQPGACPRIPADILAMLDEDGVTDD